MDKRAKFFLYLQSCLSRLLSPIVVGSYFLAMRLLGYRIRTLSRIRKACLEEFKKHPGPWMVCANHLTLIDSVILTYGILSFPGHLARFRNIPWNLPERMNFQKKSFIVAVLCYLCKCIPVHRGGDRDEMRMTLDKCNWLLDQGHSLMIFPEGGRSRTGRVDTEGFSYGVGRFVKDHPDCKVMCIYLRGDGQESWGNYPRLGERFTMLMDVLVPERVAFNGVRAQRFYAEQIILKLARMEEDYFAVRRKRHRQPERSGRPEKEREYSISQQSLYAE